MDQSLMLSQQAEAYKKQHEEMYKRLSAPDRIMTGEVKQQNAWAEWSGS